MKRAVVLAVATLLVTTGTAVGAESKYVHLGPDGKLVYVPYSNGDRIPDFSRAGYGGGGVALPEAQVRQTVTPASGDDGARVQQAINAVSALQPDSSGLRGAVLLKAGTYEVADAVTIRTSGVVLRGETGTVIKATGTKVRSLINLSGVDNRKEVAGTRKAITASYVPVGTHKVKVSDASGFKPGDDVVVVRTPNQQWVDATGTDSCSTKGTSYDTSDVSGVTCLSGTAWTPAARTIHYERRVTAVSGNEISVDSPVVEAIQSEFGGGAVYKYTFAGRVQNVGVEKIAAESAFSSATDEKHADKMISLSAVTNTWVRDVSSKYFSQGTFYASGKSKYVTVQDSQSLDHKSRITGGLRYPFHLGDATHVLVMRSLASTGRHDFVTGSNTPGPNVFLDSRGEQSHSELGPHHRWATGNLFDNVVHRSVNGNQILGAYNRGNYGTGHGWSGAYQLFYNCTGDKHKLASPPHARNWSIGTKSKSREGNGDFDSHNTPVTPRSLYLQQLQDRSGSSALRNIGY